MGRPGKWFGGRWQTALATSALNQRSEVNEMMKAEIKYGFGTAEFWGEFTAETVERQFYQHANQCFGIRKSISGFTLLSIEEEALPEPWAQLNGASTMLKHSGDTIVWNAVGDKIKSEWD